MKSAKRTCIACRESADHHQLIRLVRNPLDGKVVADLKGNLPGRGAWVHPSSICIEAVQGRPKVLAKALREEIHCDDLLNQIRALSTKKVMDTLSLTAASGGIVGGHDQLKEALGQSGIRAIILSRNIAERTRGDLLRELRPGVAVFELPLTSAELGFQVGKGPRAALGVSHSTGASRLIYQLQRRHDIG